MSTAGSDTFEYLLRLADDRLILGHRLSEWCGHAPILEEDIALANISLDLIGEANLLLQLAGEAQGEGRNPDSLAYFREAIEFRNAQIMELPKGDFALTITRQLLTSLHSALLCERLQTSTHVGLAGVAAKAYKEARYHVRHSAEWMRKLGGGTEESHARAQAALEDLWRYTGELFESDGVEQRLVQSGVAADSSALRETWRAQIATVLEEATLTMPSDGFMMTGGRSGRHTEHLGHLLAEMQIVARSYPGAEW